MEAPIYTKKLCMSELSIRLSTIPRNKFFDIQKNAKLTASFIYIAEGEAELCADTAILRLQANSLLYIPEKTCYTLKWLSTQGIKYYTVFATARSYDTAMMQDNFSLQTIPALSTPETGEIFDELYRLLQGESRIGCIRAVSVYYGFYAEVLRYLQEGERNVYHPALLKAIERIGERFTEEESVAEIAKACCISETRLYHLFRQQIGTSPVAFRNVKRVQRAVELLKTEASVEEIAENAGFRSVPYFYEIFKRFTNLTPNEYKKIVLR